MPKKKDLERKALQLVLVAGHEGLLQSDMWKGLGVSSGIGSSLAVKFEEKGVVERRKVLHNGRWTYKLFSQSKPVTIESIKDCPCIACEGLDRCLDGVQVSPLNCVPLTLWIESSTAEHDV